MATKKRKGKIARFIPMKVWVDVGGDLEACYDGAKYVDVRGKEPPEKGQPEIRIFLSREVAANVLRLFPLPKRSKAPPSLEATKDRLDDARRLIRAIDCRPLVNNSARLIGVLEAITAAAEDSLERECSRA